MLNWADRELLAHVRRVRDSNWCYGSIQASVAFAVTTTSNAFHLSDAAAGAFYGSIAEVVADTKLNGQVHYLRRAFDGMKLDGVLCIDGKPTVYLKVFKRPVRRAEANELHQKFWNQGAGTLLVLQDPNHVFIFSGLVAPNMDDGSVREHAAVVETLDLASETLEAHRFVEQVASGYYYRRSEHAGFFDADNGVDQYLLNNLGVAGELLRRDDAVDERRRVHRLLGRVIFTCYLIDREIIFLQDYSFIRKQGVKKFVDLFHNYPPTAARALLGKLFARLQADFNGSLFEAPGDSVSDDDSLSDDDVRVLDRFLRGDQLETRQRTLGYWAYDFSVMPVETISAIYEKFLEEEDAAEKQAKGAFYTPKHLAELVVDEAVSDFDTLLDKKYLDAACGSGIFLVILFNRLAEEWRRRNPTAQQRTKERELLDILENRLCGIDVNATACQIACFSLYIAFLDQFDTPTLREFQRTTKKFLPKLLAYEKDAYQNTDTPVVFEGNFFNPKLPVANDFDVVVGNPPWVGRNQPADRQVEEWIYGEYNPYLSDAPKARSKRAAIFIPQRQVAHAFLWKAPLHLHDQGRASFLLPSEVLLNQTDRFQEVWFRRFCVDRILHLADFRKFLFTGAQRPCLIASYQRKKSGPTEDRVEYIVPKVRRQDPRSGLVPVSPEDRKWIALDDVLAAARTSQAAVLWKIHLWGTPRDVRFLEYLLQLDSLGDIAGGPDEGKRWIKGKGFQPWYRVGYEASPDKYGEPKPIPGTLNDDFVKTIDESLQMFIVHDDCDSLEARLKSLRSKVRPENAPEDKVRASLTGFRRSPDRRLFEPPLVLVNKGFTKFAFVDFHALYQHSLTGIHGPNEDENLLRFLTVYLKSKLAAYFSFHTSGSWGTERDEVRVHELLRLPFPLPGSPHSSPNAESIVKDAASRMKALQEEIRGKYAQANREAAGAADYRLRVETIDEVRRSRVEQLQAELEPLVYEYFDLSDEEILLVEDTCRVYEPSSTPAAPTSSIPTLAATSPDQRLAYSTLLCETLNRWSQLDQPPGKRPSFVFYAEHSSLETTGMVLVTIKKGAKKTAVREVSAGPEASGAVARISEVSAAERGPFTYLRGVIVGDSERECIYVLKPDLLGHWTGTAALNDADAIFQAIVQSKRPG